MIEQAPWLPPLVSTSIPSSPKGFYYMHIIHRHEQFLLSPNSSLCQLISGSPYQGMRVHVTFKLLLGNVLDIIVESWLKVITTSSMRTWVHSMLTWVFSWTGWRISPLLYIIQLTYLGNWENNKQLYNHLPCLPRSSQNCVQSVPLQTHPQGVTTGHTSEDTCLLKLGSELLWYTSQHLWCPGFPQRFRRRQTPMCVTKLLHG